MGGMSLEFGNFFPIFCGACILLWLFIKFLLKRKRCTLKIPAKCIDHKKRHNKHAYSPVYEICWHGEKIRINSSVYINKIGKIRPEIGEEVWLKVNPDNPLDFCSRYDYQMELAPIIVALVFILMPIYFKYFHIQ